VAIFTKSLEQSMSTKAQDFDCVFMDREMPVMGGVEATKLIIDLQKGALAPVPVIGVSASVESSLGWSEAGVSFLLGKPFSRKDLNRVLRLIDARRAPLAQVNHQALRIHR
jgi:CheY-like chemotaxis protein